MQEVAFTRANGITYVQAALDAGLEVDEFAPRLSFFFNGHNNVSRRSRSSAPPGVCGRTIMRDRFGAKNPKSLMLRFHTQTGGSTLTAQQPENNIVRVALQAFAAVRAARSRCTLTASTRRWRCQPTGGQDRAAHPADHRRRVGRDGDGRPVRRLLLRRGADGRDRVAGAGADPQGRRARRHVNAIEFITGEIDESAWGYQERYRAGQDVVVGVNTYVEDEPEVPDLLRVDPASEHGSRRLKAFKAERDKDVVERRLEGLREPPAGRTTCCPDPPGAPRPLLDGRGLRGDARRVRPLHPDLLMAGPRRRAPDLPAPLPPGARAVRRRARRARRGRRQRHGRRDRPRADGRRRRHRGRRRVLRDRGQRGPRPARRTVLTAGGRLQAA